MNAQKSEKNQASRMLRADGLKKNVLTTCLHLLALYGDSAIPLITSMKATYPKPPLAFQRYAHPRANSRSLFVVWLFVFFREIALS